MEEQIEEFSLGKYLPMGSEGKKHTGMYVGDTWVPAVEMNQDVRDAYRGTVDTLYPTSNGDFTKKFWESAVSVELNKDTGNIVINAPSQIMQEDWFKKNYLENDNLKKLSQAYKLNPNYSFETTNEEGKTVYKTAEQMVSDYDAGLKKAAEDLNKVYSERDRVLRPVYGAKVDNMTTEDIRTALTPTYNVGDIKVTDSTVIALPDFLLNHSIFGEQVKKLASFNAENRTVTRGDFMENFWNRNKNPELTAERIQELYQNLGTSLKYSSWEDVVEDDYERHGANQAAREIAFRNFIQGQDPEADFWLQAGDTFTAVMDGAVKGITDFGLGVLNISEWIGGNIATGINAITPWDDPVGAKTYGMQKKAEEWDSWKAYNSEQLQLISDSAAAWDSIAELGTELVLNIWAGNKVGGLVSGGLGTVGKVAMDSLDISKTSGLGRTISAFVLALEDTRDAGQIIKNAIGAQKIFSAGGALTGSIVNITTQAIVDATLTDPVLFRRVIEGEGGDEAYDYLNEQFAWNILGFGAGIGLGKLAMGAANTKVGRAINAKWAKGNAKLKTLGYNITDGLKSKIAGRSLEDTIAQQDEVAKAAAKTEKDMYKVQSMRTAEQLDTLKAETRAFAKADIDVFDGLKISDDGLAEAEKYITNIKNLQNAIDSENRSIRMLVEMYDDVKVNPEMAGINKVMKQDVDNIIARERELTHQTGRTFAPMQGSVFTQESANYVGASIELKYMEAVLASPEYFAKGTVESAAKNIDSYREAIAKYTNEFSPELKDALDKYVSDGKQWYASMNQYRSKQGLSNAQDLEDLLQSKMFEKGDYMRVQRKIDHRYTETILEDGTKHTNINIEFQHLDFAPMSDFMAPDTVQAMYKVNTANAERNLGVLKTRLSVKSAFKETLVSGEETQLAKNLKVGEPGWKEASKEYTSKIAKDNVSFDARELVNSYDNMVNLAKKESSISSEISKTEKQIEKTVTKTYHVNDAERVVMAETMAPTDVKKMLTDSGKSQTGSVLQDGIEQFGDDAEGFEQWLNGLPDDSKRTLNKVKREYNNYVGGMSESPSAESLRLRDEIANNRREIEYITGDETTKAWNDYEMWAKNADAEGMTGEYKQFTDEQTKLSKDILERRMKAIGYDGEISPAGRADFNAWVQKRRADYESGFNERLQRLNELRGGPKSITFDSSQTAKGINRKNLPEPSGKKVSEKTRKKLMEDAFGTADGDGLANAWFDGGDVTAKKEIATKLSNDTKLRDAALYEMYELSGSELPYSEWLDTPMEMRRVQSVDNLRNDDAFVSFSMKEDWRGPANVEGVEGDLVTLTIKPKDTYGSIYLGEFGGEKEVFVPRDAYRKAWDSKVSELQTNVDDIKMKMEDIRGKYAPASDADYPGFKVSDRDDGNMNLLSMLDESDPKATREGTLRDYYRDYKGKEVAVVEMEPDEYNRLMERDSSGRALSDAEKKTDKYYDKKFKDGERVPLVSIQYDEYGGIIGQEGRHRSAAAGRAGIEKMPVVIEYPTGKKPLKMYEYEDVTEKFVKKAETEPKMSLGDIRQMRRYQDDLDNAEAFLKDYTTEKPAGSPQLRGMTRENVETLIGVDPNLEDTINLQVLKNDKDLLKSEQITQMAEEQKRINENFALNNTLKTQKDELVKVIGERYTDDFLNEIVDFSDKTIDNFIAQMESDPKTQKYIKTIAATTGDSEADVARYLALTALEKNQKEINKQIRAAFGNADKKMTHIGTQVENAFDSMLTSYVDDIMMRMGDSDLVSGALWDRVKEINNKINGLEGAVRDDFSNVIAMTDAKGRKEILQVDPTIAKLFKTNVGNLQRPDGGWFSGLNKLLSKTFRLGTTGANLSSTLRQWFRDSGNAFGMGAAFKKVQTCSGELIDDWGERIVQQLDDYDVAQLAKRAEETGTDIKKLAVERELRIGEIAAGQTTEVTLYRESLSRSKKLQENVKGKIDKIEDIMNGKRENYLRNRVYANNLLQAMNNGHTLEEARTIAEFAMNNATTNFSRKLVHMQRIADSAPYLSAAINGTKSFWRMATLDPVGVTTRIMAGFVVPQMYLTASSLANESDRKVYENLPEYTKSENFVFVQNGVPITIPIPQELAFIVDPFRQFTESLYGANKNNFWELAANDILGAMPMDLSGFSTVDMDDMIADPTIFDRIGRGVSRVFSQVAPIPVKSIYMAATGIDPYTGKKLRDKSWVVWNDDTSSYETMDYNQSSLATMVAGWFGDNGNATLTEKVLSGALGNTVMDVLDTVVAAFQKMGGDEKADLTHGLKDQIGRVGSSLTGEDYSTLNSEWKRAIAQLEEERDVILNSKEMQDIKSKLSQDIDDDTRQKLIAKRKDLLADWQKRVGSTVSRLSEQGGTLDRYKFAAVVQLLNMNSADGWVPSNKYLQNLASQNYYAGRDEAYQTLQSLGITGTNDYSIFGYYRRKGDETSIVYNTPTSIVTAGNLLLSAKDVDKANIDAIIKKEDLYTQREEMYKQTDAIYNKSKLTNADYNAIDAIKMAYNNKVLSALMPYIEKVSPEALTNNEQVMDVLENLIQVPSAYEKVNNRYISSGGGKLNKQQGFVRSYIKAILNKDNM